MGCARNYTWFVSSVLVGDLGGFYRIPQLGKDYNIALVLDISTSMSTEWGNVNPKPTCIETANWFTDRKGMVGVPKLVRVIGRNEMDIPLLNRK